MVCGLVVIQSQQDEARRVDAVVVLSDCQDRACQDHVFNLYRRRYATRLVFAGSDAEACHNALIERGLPSEALLLADSQAEGAARMREVAAFAWGQGIARVLLVDDAYAQLLHLKTARDLGLEAYSSPVPGAAFDIGVVIQSGVAYWGYVLRGY